MLLCIVQMKWGQATPGYHIYQTVPDQACDQSNRKVINVYIRLIKLCCVFQKKKLLLIMHGMITIIYNIQGSEIVASMQFDVYAQQKHAYCSEPEPAHPISLPYWHHISKVTQVRNINFITTKYILLLL